jgi:hypothetical protein
VALTLQQLDTTLHDSLLMCSTSLNFVPTKADIEACESDFLAVVVGARGLNESPVQILIGEAKTHRPFTAEDVRKLGKLADAIPANIAQSFILFAKTDVFTPAEIEAAKTLNTQYRRRVILWSQNELEPYFAYERSKDESGQAIYASSLTDMAFTTERLWFS